MGQKIVINNLNIENLNKILKEDILVTKSYIKNELLIKSFKNKELIKFKLFTEEEFKSYSNVFVPKEIEYLIYKKVKNYNLSKLIYNSLDVFLPFYFYNKQLGKKKKFKDYNANLIIDIIKYLDTNNCLNSLYLNFEEKIYSLDVDLKYLGIKYKSLEKVEKEEKKKIDVLEFKTAEDEIYYMFNEISKLLKIGKIRENNIKIYGSKTYENLVLTISNYFNINIYEENFHKLKDYEIKKIMSQIKCIKNEKNKKSNSTNKKQKIGVADINNIERNFFYTEVYNLLNDYLDKIKEEEFEEFIYNKLKNIKIKKDKLDKCITFLPIKEYSYNEDNYNFILGFNDYNFINYAKDTGFLKKETLNILNLEDSIKKNKKKEEKVKNIIYFMSNKKNNILSYSIDFLGEKVKVNSLIDKNQINVVSKNITEQKTRYSKIADIYNFKKYTDKSIKENKKYDEVAVFNDNLSINEKKTFDFHMQGSIKWDQENFKKTKNISATLLEKYNRCNFIFYIENILQIKKNKRNINALDLGNYIHGILELVVNQNEINNYLKLGKIDEELLNKNIIKAQRKFLEKEKNIFINYGYKKELILYKINNYLKHLISQIVIQISKENFKIFLTEENMDIKFMGYNLVGKIDSVLKSDNYYIIIDYKTGSSKLDFDLQKLELGINLQNIIYYILLKYKYPDSLLGGTYRVKVKPKIVKDLKENIPFRDGYTNKKKEVIQSIDFSNYKNLSLKRDGSYSVTSKVIDDEKIDQILKIANTKLLTFINDINTKNYYDINPLKKSVDACEYCNYFDICFKSAKDYKKELGEV